MSRTTPRRRRTITSIPTPRIERVRELAEERAGDDDELLFYDAARELGFTDAEAEEVDELLTTRVMRARGGI